MKIIIIGAGIGGLGAANLLAQDGHEVHVYESLPRPGGRAGLLEQDGFRFDTGPSWYLMPGVFDRYYQLLGRDVSREFELIRLSPAYKVFFEHTKPLIITGKLGVDADTFEAIEPGAGDALRRYVTRGEVIYRLSLEHFLYSDFSSIKHIAKRALLKHAARMLHLATTSLHRYVQTFVRDIRLQQILEYPMVFLGTSPFKAPAIYSLMSALDFREGVYYPQGGIYSIIESLYSIGTTLGVQYHFNQPVKKIRSQGITASGIELESGEFVTADIVISNADLHFTETRLLEQPAQSYPETYWQRKEPGPTALMLYLGIKGNLPAFEHHNLLFVDDWRGNFDAIEKRDRVPDPTSIYICRASATDPIAAPAGHENIFVLIPLPAGNTIKSADIPALTEKYLAQISRMTGVDLMKSVVTRAAFTPDDFAATYHAWQSTMLGQSHKLTQSAFFRTKNKSKKLRNLYYVGANTLPGIGLPMCLISAELVADRIRKDYP